MGLAQVIRPMFSNPPRFGAAIVVTVLSDPELYALWRVRPGLDPGSSPNDVAHGDAVRLMPDCMQAAPGLHVMLA